MIALIGVVVGAVLAALSGVLLAYLTRASEYEKWLRAERLRVYSSFMTGVTTIGRKLGNGDSGVWPTEAEISNFIADSNQIRLLGPEAAVKAANKQVEALMNGYYRKEDALPSAVKSGGQLAHQTYDLFTKALEQPSRLKGWRSKRPRLSSNHDT